DDAGNQEDEAEGIDGEVYVRGDPSGQPAAKPATEGPDSDAEREDEREGEGSLLLGGELGDCGRDADGPDGEGHSGEEGERELDGDGEQESASREDCSCKEEHGKQHRTQTEAPGEAAGGDGSSESTRGGDAGEE